jgi:hypothetical protein
MFSRVMNFLMWCVYPSEPNAHAPRISRRTPLAQPAFCTQAEAPAELLNQQAHRVSSNSDSRARERAVIFDITAPSCGTHPLETLVGKAGRPDLIQDKEENRIEEKSMQKDRGEPVT